MTNVGAGARRVVRGVASGTVTRIRLHHEWHGDEDSPHPPLLLIHGGGSTIPSNWGMLLPLLERDRSVLAVELQGHGRTAAGDRAPSLEASADDVAAVLGELRVGPVDVLGFGTGGQVALQLAARHPGLVRRLVLASTPVRKDAMADGFGDGLAAGTFEDVPGEVIASVSAPTLVAGADRDAVRAEHFVLLSSQLPYGRLLIVPGIHGDYVGERTAAAGDDRALKAFLPYLLAFLDAPGA